jgi:glutathione synthase/RimK-type ligase-like ATP-grasp enzyme
VSAIRIGIVHTFTPAKRWHYPMGRALTEAGVDWVPLDARFLRAEVLDRGGPRVTFAGDPDITEATLDDLALDGVVWRASEAYFDRYADILELLCDRYRVVNNWRCSWICSDKWRTSSRLAAAGLPVVPTTLLTAGMAVPEFPGAPATVVKPCVGAGGHGVRLVEPGTVLDGTEPHVAQPLVAGDGGDHVRVIVLGGNPVAAVHRIPAAGNTRTSLQINNVTAGGTPVAARLEPVHDLAAAVSRFLGGDILGVDLVPVDDGYAVLEVNSAPGFNGVDEVCGIDSFKLAAEQVINAVRGG